MNKNLKKYKIIRKMKVKKIKKENWLKTNL